MNVKTWATLAALLSAALLAAVIYVTVNGSSLVTPTAGARLADKGGDRRAVEKTLAGRTAGQAESAVANGAKSLEISTAGQRIKLNEPTTMPFDFVGTWRSQIPGDGKQLLQPPAFRNGVASLPYREADVLVQPQGRDFRQTRNSVVRYAGGILIFAVCLALSVFLLWRGRIGTGEPAGGKNVLRFDAFERTVHWMTASAFLVMALTGVVILYGKSLLLPLIGAYAFSALAEASAWIHMASAAPFTLGIVLMMIRWLPANMPTRLDWIWLRHFGGFLRDDAAHPPAGRFNAGQKLVFWSVALGGLALLATGVLLMLPFFVLGYSGMQWAQLAHGGIGLGLIALIIGHIYIGSIGMVGAFQAMWSGLVDRNWAKTHHRLWYERLKGR